MSPQRAPAAGVRAKPMDSTKLPTESGDVLKFYIVIEHWNSEVIAWLLTNDDGVTPAKAVIEQALKRSFGDALPTS